VELIYYFLAMLAVLLLMLINQIKEKPIAATSDDWYVIFSVDAEKKQLWLWFYPIVGFRQINAGTVPITSRPSTTKKLSQRKAPQMVNNEICGVSVSYGRWARNDALFDDVGDAEDDTFSSIVGRYLRNNFEISYSSSIPNFYQQLIMQKCLSIAKDREDLHQP
jgi:hypothetical protein